MASRKIIKLLDHQHNTLRDLMEAEMVPDGQFIRRWTWFRQLVETFNELTECSFSPEAIHHYVMTLRKRPLGRLPRWEPMGTGCAKMPGAEYVDLTAEEEDLLVQAYCALANKLAVGSDSILVDGKHRRELSRNFASLTGRGINDRSLIAAVINLRKNDRLPKLGGALKMKKPKRGFGDFDQAEAM